MAAIEHLAEALPGIARVLMRNLINEFARAAPPRPHRHSLWSPSDPKACASDAPCGEWTAWPGLFDKSYTGRHLGPGPVDRTYPEIEAVLDLFERQGEMTKGRSTVLFALFAQWFTDSFLRTMSGDARRTDSNHEIDLCQVYGLDERSTNALRTHAGDGKLKMRATKRGLLPPLLFKDGFIDPAFLDLSYLRPTAVIADGVPTLFERSRAWSDKVDSLLGDAPGPISDARRRDTHYALGLDRGGSTIVYSAITTVFMREHNSIADQLKARYPDWSDERLFQTARLVNMRQVLTIVVEDYISHIAGLPVWLDRDFAERENWYRSNRTSIEFNLLYRWHGMVPDVIRIDGIDLGHRDYRFNNFLVEEHGVGRILAAASRMPAGQAELGNTPRFLRDAERASLGMARRFRLQGLNAYRERFGMERHRSFEDLTGDAENAQKLANLYGSVDEVEFTVGLFSERRRRDYLFGETLTTMVAHDAFTHILTNPLLAAEVHCPEVYSELGLEIVARRANFAQIVAQNCEDEESEIRFSIEE